MMSVAEPKDQTTLDSEPLLACPSANGGQPRQKRVNNLTARNILTLLVFVLGFSPLALTSPMRQEEPLARQLKGSRDLPNFRVVHSYFYRGAAPSYTGMDELKTLGVKTIIDLRRTPIMIEAERAYVSKLGIEYISLPMGDWIPSAEKQKLFMSVMTRACNDPAHSPVFLHCSHGSDRTGFLTALWRVEHDHWSVGQAVAEMLEHGFLVHKLDSNPASRIDN
jgi:hypothetical protein